MQLVGIEGKYDSPKYMVKEWLIYKNAAEAELMVDLSCLSDSCSEKLGNSLHWIPENWTLAHPGNPQPELSTRQVVQLPCVRAAHKIRVHYSW